MLRAAIYVVNRFTENGRDRRWPTPPVFATALWLPALEPGQLADEPVVCPGHLVGMTVQPGQLTADGEDAEHDGGEAGDQPEHRQAVPGDPAPARAHQSAGGQRPADDTERD